MTDVPPTRRRPTYLLTTDQHLTDQEFEQIRTQAAEILDGRVIVLDRGAQLYVEDESGDFVPPPKLEGPAVREVLGAMEGRG